MLYIAIQSEENTSIIKYIYSFLNKI
jgi:hypothetical protein